MVQEMTDNDTPADVAALAEAMHGVCIEGFRVARERNLPVTQHSADAHLEEARHTLPFLPEGWHLSNRAEAGAEVLALRAALDKVADTLQADEANDYYPTGEAMVQAWHIAVEVLANTAPEAERIRKDLVAPWRAALERLAHRHGWEPNGGKCICGPHGMARALLGGE
jgi:hypothetical protein